MRLRDPQGSSEVSGEFLHRLTKNWKGSTIKGKEVSQGAFQPVFVRGRNMKSHVAGRRLTQRHHSDFVQLHDGCHPQRMSWHTQHVVHQNHLFLQHYRRKNQLRHLRFTRDKPSHPALSSLPQWHRTCLTSYALTALPQVAKSTRSQSCPNARDLTTPPTFNTHGQRGHHVANEFIRNCFCCQFFLCRSQSFAHWAKEENTCRSTGTTREPSACAKKTRPVHKTQEHQQP